MSSPLCTSLLHVSSTSTMFTSQLGYMNLMKPYISDYINDHNTSMEPNQLKHVQISPQTGSPTTPSKKRVSFADSIGLELVHVRHMTAGRDTPPNLDPSIIASLEPSSKKHALLSLTPTFQQPVSNYINFRQSLDRNNVQLESVSVNGNTIIGTVKVKNLAYHKTVSVHISFDGWKTSQNITAYYVNNGLSMVAPSAMPSSIDTFSFTMDIPMVEITQHNIEFAVCYHAGGQEFWDNNDNKNYTISVNGDSPKSVAKQYWQGSPLETTNWTDFAIWKSLESDYTPYW